MLDVLLTPISIVIELAFDIGMYFEEESIFIKLILTAGLALIALAIIYRRYSSLKVAIAAHSILPILVLLGVSIMYTETSSYKFVQDTAERMGVSE